MVQPHTNKSTTGRAASLVPAAIGLARVSAPLFPAAATALAFRVFMTPRRHERPEREHALIARGEPLIVDGGRIAAHRFGEGEPVVLMHGWEGRGAQLGAFVPPLLERGFSVIAPDAPGHGDTAGERASIVDFAETLLAVQDRTGPLAGVIAHSFGGAATALALMRGLRAESVVFIGAPSSMRARVREFLALVGLPADLAPRLEDHIAAVVGIHPRDVEARDLGRSMRTPLLVVHDRQDREVGFACAEDYLASWPGARALVTEGLGHRRVLRDEAVVAAAVDFVRAHATEPKNALAV